MKKKVLAVILTVFMSCQSAIVYAGELEEVFSDPGIESVEEEVVEDEFTDGEIQFDTEENEETSEELINDGEEIPDVEDTEENVYPAEENYLIYGDFTYTVSNNQVTVRGYKGSATTIEVPEQIDGKKVVGIADGAFEGCAFLEEITLPEGLEYIGYHFIKGTNVSRIEIPSSVKESGYYGNHYMTTGGGALGGALALEEVVFADGMKKIPSYICSNNINEKNSVLSKVVIPDSVTEIGDYAFYNCSGLKEINFKKEINTVGESAFNGCKNLETVVFNKNPKVVMTSSGKKLYPVTIKNAAFANCIALKNVQLTENIEILEEGVFINCSTLEEVTLVKGIKTISDQTFEGCSSLEKVVLPEGLEYIGYHFIKGTNVSRIEIPSSVKESGYYGNHYMTTGGGALGGALALEEVVFADGMKKIPSYICSNNINEKNSVLSKVVIPDSVTEIGDYAFYNCSGLKEINFKKEINTVGESAFNGCKNLETVVFNKNPKVVMTSSGKKLYPVTIKNAAFANCIALKNVQLTENIEILEEGAFINCSALEEVTLVKGIKTISDQTFEGCSSLEKVVLPEGLEYIGYHFIKGTNVSRIEIPSSVKESGYYGNHYMTTGGGALGGALALEEVVFADGMKKIPSYICSNNINEKNSVLSKVVIPDSVTEIGNYAFYNCGNMTIYGTKNSYAQTYAKQNNIPFEILKEDASAFDISKAKISSVKDSYEYTGKAIKPTPKVTLKNKVLT